MLTEKEKHGISELLARLPARDLNSLAQTVTSRLILPETSSEAISAILLHTEKPSDLLRRRKIKRELLFKYLHAKKVSIEASADKSVFVSHVLQLWGSNQQATVGPALLEEDSLPEAPAPSRNTSYSSLLSLDFNHPLSTHGLLRDVINQHIDSDNENSLEMQEDMEAASASTPSTLEVMEMACSFVRWYYPLLNGSLDCDDAFGSHHFWLDASARVTLQAAPSGPSESTGVEENGRLASELLKDVVRKHGLTFNPNVSPREGVQGVIDAHGLALVTAAGTLHAGPRLCGTFTQQFGLARDPSTSGNNWKIKFTHATLVSSSSRHCQQSELVFTSSTASSSVASSSPPSRESPSSSSGGQGHMAFS